MNIVTVNNPDMITLKKLSTKFEAANPDIKLNWLVLEENIMRQRITTDTSTGGGQFDVIFIGLYEAPLFAKRGWLTAMEDLPADYDIEDVFKSLRDGLSHDGKLYALPFNGESSMLMYRKDLFEAKGLKMPEQATYDDIKKFAEALSDKGKGIYGITLRGKPGWGENMAFVGTLVNTFGGAWFDMDWKATIDTPGVEKRDYLLCRSDESLWASRRHIQRVQREPDDLCHRKGGDVDRRDFRCGSALRSEGIASIRQGCVCQCSHCSNAEWFPLAVVLGVCNPQVLEVCGCGQEVCALGYF